MAENPAQQLIKFGQSVWYDNISRDLINSGDLKKLRDTMGVRGLTSNPTIFDNAISKSSVYDSIIAQQKKQGANADEIFEAIAVQDCGDAADLLRPIFDSSKGDDGYVSIEVSPLLAADTKGTVEEGRRLFKKLNRPNIMIKVPGTTEGIPAIRTLLEDGINVNVTLLFSDANYRDVAQTYITALGTRMKKGQPIADVRSVASFFVSRVDSIIDTQLQKIIDENKTANASLAEKAQSLLGQFGIANSKIAYKSFTELFNGSEFAALRQNGAAVQRPLWASTSTKNPKYRDVMYVEQLIGRDTVNTMPHDTLIQFADHGVAADTITSGMDRALKLESELKGVGVDVNKLLVQLQVEGVKKFSDSFHALRKTITEKLG